MNTEPYRQLETKIVAWANDRPDIRAVVAVGSRARATNPADDLADLDLVLFTLDPQIYSPQPENLDLVGPLWLVVANHHVAAGHPEWMVLFAGGHKVDFYFAPIDEAANLTETLPTMPFQGVLARGMRVLIDKTDTGSGRPTLSASGARQGRPQRDEPSWPPSADQFYAEVEGTLLSASRAVKFIQRRDLWRAKFQVDTDLKRRLLTFIEWQAQAAAGREIDTWYDGRFLAEWATTRVLEALPATFAAYELRDLLRALRATLALFDRLVRDAAGRSGLLYPQPHHQAVSDWLNEQLEAAEAELG